MTQMTVTEIVEETVQFYSEDVNRRSMDHGSCQYTAADGRHCAIGRCLIDDSFVGDNTSIGEPSGSIDEFWPTEENMNNALKTQYRGHPLNFWEGLQCLHDMNRFWDHAGITNEGRKIADNLIRDFA